MEEATEIGRNRSQSYEVAATPPVTMQRLVNNVRREGSWLKICGMTMAA